MIKIEGIVIVWKFLSDMGYDFFNLNWWQVSWGYQFGNCCAIWARTISFFLRANFSLEILPQYGLEETQTANNLSLSMDEKFNSGNSTAIWAMGKLQIIYHVYKMQRLLRCSVCGQTCNIILQGWRLEFSSEIHFYIWKP